MTSVFFSVSWWQERFHALWVIIGWVFAAFAKFFKSVGWIFWNPMHPVEVWWRAGGNWQLLFALSFSRYTSVSYTCLYTHSLDTYNSVDIICDIYDIHDILCRFFVVSRRNWRHTLRATSQQTRWSWQLQETASDSWSHDWWIKPFEGVPAPMQVSIAMLVFGGGVKCFSNFPLFGIQENHWPSCSSVAPRVVGSALLLFKGCLARFFLANNWDHNIFSNHAI